MSLKSMRDYAEKRDFIRMMVNTTIHLTDSSNGSQYQGNCRDLSSTGMSIAVNQYIPADTELNTTLPSNNEAFPAFDTTIRVTRCTDLGNETYLVGAEILRII